MSEQTYKEITFDNKESVPEGLEVEERDGKFIGKVVPYGHHKEFRENNMNLAKELEAAKAQQDAVLKENQAYKAKMDEIAKQERELKEAQEREQDKEKLTKEQFAAKTAEKLTKKHEEEKAAILAEKEELAKKAEESNSTLSKYRQRIAVNSAVDKIKTLDPLAKSDFAQQMAQAFDIDEEDNLVAKGEESYSIDDWVAKQKEAKPYFFQKVTGSDVPDHVKKGLKVRSGFDPHAKYTAKEVNAFSDAELTAYNRARGNM